MKIILVRIALILIVASLVWLCIPKSCGSGEVKKLETKSELSILRDSLERVHAKKLNAHSDSIVKVYKDSIASIQQQVASTKASYYALRKVVKQLQSVRVDSAGQTIEVPAITYNASVNSGNMCDSLLMYQDQELALKDSIISTREIQLKACGKENATKEQALQDQIALSESEKKEAEKAHKLNKRIPLIATLSAFAGSLLTIILLK